MGLSPEEEETFAGIISELRRQRRGGIPWFIVVPSVVLVGIAVVVAALLGVHHHLVTLFYGTFLAGLGTGLSVIEISDRRTHL